MWECFWFWLHMQRFCFFFSGDRSSGLRGQGWRRVVFIRQSGSCLMLLLPPLLLLPCESFEFFLGLVSVFGMLLLLLKL